MLLGLARLDQGQHLEQLVERPEAAGEGDQRLGQVEEPVFPYEEVMELEVQLGGDVRVMLLFEGEGDAEPHGASARLMGAAVRRFHDPGSTTGHDREALLTQE